MTTLQGEQQQLLEQAEATPGVQELIETFAPIAPYMGLVVESPEPLMAYATGGNV